MAIFQDLICVKKQIFCVRVWSWKGWSMLANDNNSPLQYITHRQHWTRQISHLTLEPYSLSERQFLFFAICSSITFAFRRSLIVGIPPCQMKRRVLPETVTLFISHSQYHKFYYHLFEFSHNLFSTRRTANCLLDKRRKTKAQIFFFLGRAGGNAEGAHTEWAVKRNINRSHIFFLACSLFRFAIEGRKCKNKQTEKTRKITDLFIH